MRNPESVSTSYGYVLKHRIRAKLAAIGQEINLLDRAGLIAENYKNLTEFRKDSKSN